jgi:hypothetical protein
MTEDYWKTLEGIMTRITDIAHNLTWSILNTAIKAQGQAIKENPPDEFEELIELEDLLAMEPYWTTMYDGKVCEVCEALEGPHPEGESYGITIPAHPLCRCFWTYE